MNKSKKVITTAMCLLCAASTVIAAAPLSAGAAEITANESAESKKAINVTGLKVPMGELQLGSAYGINGVIRTADDSATLVKVWGGVYMADGKTQVFYHEADLNSTTCDIEQEFDYYMAFNEMNAGDYIFKIEATDSKGNTETVIESAFSIVNNGKIPSAIGTVSLSVPADTIPAELPYYFSGVITASYVLKKVWGGVYNADGTPTDVYFEESTNVTRYDIGANLNSKLAMEKLPAGNYIYKIECSDISGGVLTVAEKAFTIADKDAPSDISIYNAAYPSGNVPLGRGVIVGGYVASSYDITKINAGIYNVSGGEEKPTDYVYEFSKIDGNQYDLSVLDDTIEFNKLPLGNYVYKISVTDVNGTTKEIINSEFSIINIENTEDSAPVLMNGVDISSYQGDVDFDKLRSDNIDFVILRAAYTSNYDANVYEDKHFEQYYKAAKAAGLKVGVYIYTSAFNTSEMTADINELAELLNDKEIDLPVYIDIEAGRRQSSLGKTSLTEVIDKGCELLEAKGYKAGVYSSMSWFLNYIDAVELRSKGYELWVAYWPDVPADFDLSKLGTTWQYCSDGIVKGIDGDADKNYRYKALSDAKHNVTVEISQNGSVKADKTACGYGERVALTVQADSGYALKSLKCGDTEIEIDLASNYSFFMPDEDAFITAEFETADNLTYFPEVMATCTEDGTISYYRSEYGKFYKEQNGNYVEIPEESKISPAFGHTFDEPEWIWSDDKTSASVVFTCKKCGEKQTVQADVTSVKTEPTYTDTGSIVYSAAATFEGKEYTTSVTVELPKLLTDEKLRNMAIKDYQTKAHTAPSKTNVSRNEDDKTVIELLNDSGEKLNVYTVDNTGKGTDQTGAAIGLPKTGYSGIHKAIAGLAALMTAAGTAILVKTRHRDEK